MLVLHEQRPRLDRAIDEGEISDHSRHENETEPVSDEPRHSHTSTIWRAQSLLIARWRSSMGASTNRRIFSSAAIVGVSILLVKLLAMAKDLVVAGSFGTGSAIDAFLIAFVLPAFVSGLVGGSISAAFVPTFVEVKEKHGEREAYRLLSSVMVLSLGLRLLTTLVLAALGPNALPFLAKGFDAETLALTRRLFFLMLPCVIATGVGWVWVSVLHAKERFALGELAQM